MTPDKRTLLADDLAQAYDTGVPISPPSQDTTLTVHDAYAVQTLQIQRWVAAGAQVRGHKVGLTSRAMQRMFGVGQPDYGHLLDTMFLPPGEPAAITQFLQVRAEPEIAFVLGSDLRGPGVTLADALRSVEFAIAALELIDSRIRDWQITLVDTIADNASCGAVVLGSRPVRLDQVDSRLAGCNLYRNAALIATGAGGAVLGDPLNALVWLANTLGRLGVTLEAGEVVLPGSCTPAFPVSAGDTIRADFAGFGAVSVSFRAKQAA